jgi:hypothetical protein
MADITQEAENKKRHANTLVSTTGRKGADTTETYGTTILTLGSFLSAPKLSKRVKLRLLPQAAYNEMDDAHSEKQARPECPMGRSINTQSEFA